MVNKAFENQKGKGITSTEQARRLGSMGGKAAQETHKKKKIFKELITDILNQPATEKMTNQIQKAFEVKGQNLTLKEAMVYAQTIKAISKQDTQAFNALVDRVDGKAVQETNIEHSGEMNTKTVYIEKKEKKELEEHIIKTINAN